MVRQRSSYKRLVGRVGYSEMVGHRKEFEFYSKFKRKLLKWLNTCCMENVMQGSKSGNRIVSTLTVQAEK